MHLFHFKTGHPVTEEPIEVEAEYWPSRRGARDADGILLEPDEPAEVVIRTVWNRYGVIAHQDCEEALVVHGLKVAYDRRCRIC